MLVDSFMLFSDGDAEPCNFHKIFFQKNPIPAMESGVYAENGAMTECGLMATLSTGSPERVGNWLLKYYLS